MKNSFAQFYNSLGILFRNKSIPSVLLLFLVNGFVHGQKINVSGVVSSILDGPLENANILVFDSDDSATFAISNQKGEYSLRLDRGYRYNITVSYLGYEEKNLEFIALEDEIIDFNLESKTNELDEVVLAYKVPIVVKKDTIIYQTKAFVDGNERKLREVLKKLPGIEVDRDGNVTAQGKEITKVLVDNKLFFTGNSKLAINNIPADVVGEIEVLDNYNELGFLKGLRDTNEVALNIKLKEDRKKFAFGDVEIASGPKKEYLIHPNVFFYSPQTTVNFIGDFNDVGTQSFELDDYIEFNGGFGNLLKDNRGYSSLINDSFSNFLSNDNFKANINRFGALNIRNSVSNKIDINSYVILSNNDTSTEVNTLNEYYDNDSSISELRNNNNELDNNFILGKLKLDYEPNAKEDLALNTLIKINKNELLSKLLTNSPDKEILFNTESRLDVFDLKQNFEYSKRFSKRQTFSLESSLNLISSSSNNIWTTNESFLEELIPLKEDDSIIVAQDLDRRITTFDLTIKNYWTLNNFNHIYTSIGLDLLFESFSSNEIQRLSDGSLNYFFDDGFGNDINYRFANNYLGLEYKFLSGIFTVTSGLFYHNYLWNNSQLDLTTKKKTSAFLPELKVEAEFNKSEKLIFRYQQRWNFPQSTGLMNRLFLDSFNSVFRGDFNLQNERFHTISSAYYKFSLFSGLNLNFSMSYNRKTQSFKNETILDGIDQFVTSTMFNRPENSLIGNFRLSKRLGKVKLGVISTGNYNEFFQLVNNESSKNISTSILLTGKIETFFDDSPNFEFEYSIEPTHFKTNISTSSFINREIFTSITYDFLSDFKFKSDFRNVNYENLNQRIFNSLNIANSSLFYQKEDSPWGFEFSISNIFNNKIRRQNTFSDFLISDETTFIIPRIFLLKLSYKF